MELCNPTTGQCKYCENGFYKDGVTCRRCPANCLNGTCNVMSGVCQACEDGSYGPFCKSCSSGCVNPVCDKKYECVSGYYDARCDKKCPSNCLTCVQTSGQCTACEPGAFGSDCNQSCSNSCAIDGCHQDNGYCLACKTGYYGLDCKEECGHCIDDSCDMINGSCICMEGWGGKRCNVTVVSTPEEVDGVYVGAGVGGTAVIALVSVAIFIILKRKISPTTATDSSHCSNKTSDNLETNPDKQERGSFDEPAKDRSAKGELLLDFRVSHEVTEDECELVYMNLRDIRLDEEVVYSNSHVSLVPVNELRTIIDSKMANDSEAFQEEFKTFQMGAIHPHEEGKKAVNRNKNRFKTTFPYDHSRVILERSNNDTDTTYINANYIDSIDTNKVYIASQGPKPNTLDDFWRMVWHVNSGKIVMLTNLIEGTKIKCHQYWPEEGEQLNTDTFELKLDRERIYAFYVLRDISIVNRKTKEERQVHQFHFTTWPDHGTPDTLELVLFHRRVTLYEAQLPGQMVVHCSAGIGRTGTFIALDALLASGRDTGHVDIPSYIRIMRKDRMNMIQTYEQYIALHEILVEGFNLQDTYISRWKFRAVLESLTSDSRPANFTKLNKEFEKLQNFNPNYTSSSFTSALLRENEDKNRDFDILAVDKFRAFLQSQQPNRADYINAVIIQSHTSRFGYLMTQFPLKDTVDDFWTMVFDYSCDNIVVIGTLPDDQWLPDKQLSVGGFVVQKLKERSTNYDIVIADYQVANKLSTRQKTVQIFFMNQWSSDSLLPSSSSPLLLLLEQLDSRRRSDNTKPVVVMCRNGCTQSGLFCCISNVRDQMKMDDGVDVFQTARQLKQRRPEALIDMKQYEYCYNVLGQYLNSTDVYIN
ncbi:receptor-type tyrosine-protein phosphatase mu-like [Ylistrum balloti]|uniref:receptor-type tyrosine-protein phosphatase mu-like n=1 Tax=Ylistrum balloti TaxID=509963 RepID=UPI002905D781|nr:receptor-type tyrosine-protein phosphatase mu-like [Ylistrum balloti]